MKNKYLIFQNFFVVPIVAGGLIWMIITERLWLVALLIFLTYAFVGLAAYAEGRELSAR
jgi:hypothetical protein